MAKKSYLIVECPKCEHKITLSVASTRVAKRPSAFSEAAKDFIHHYQLQYRDVMTNDPDRQPAINWPRIMPLAMKAVQRYGLEKLSIMLRVYFDSDEPFYQKNFWSLEIFLSTAVLNKLNMQSQ